MSNRPLRLIGAAAEEHAFGHFHLYCAIGQSRCLQRIDQARRESAAAQLGRRGVDRDAAIGEPAAGPALQVVEQVVEHDLAEQVGDLGIVERGVDRTRRLDLAAGVAPPQQRLEPDQRAGVKRHLGLVVGDHVTADRGGARAADHRRALAHLVLHLWPKDQALGAAAALRRVERNIGMAHQFGGIAPMLGVQGGANARSAIDLTGRPSDRLPDGKYPARALEQRFGIADLGQHDCEFIAAEPRGDRAGWQRQR